MSLLEVFGLEPGAVIALVGGGGTTTLMFALAHAAAPDYSVITTTTTKIARPSRIQSEVVLVDSSEAVLETQWLAVRDRARHATLAAGATADRQKLTGVRPEFVDRLATGRLADFVIVEADGAKHRSLKAPNDTEPVVPG